MNHQNRGRLTVDQNGNWRHYSPVLPRGSTPLGTVSDKDFGTGALVRIDATGLYAQVNAGIVRSLIQRKVEAALRDAQDKDIQDG